MSTDGISGSNLPEEPLVQIPDSFGEFIEQFAYDLRDPLISGKELAIVDTFKLSQFLDRDNIAILAYIRHAFISYLIEVGAFVPDLDDRGYQIGLTLDMTNINEPQLLEKVSYVMQLEETVEKRIQNFIIANPGKEDDIIKVLRSAQDLFTAYKLRKEEEDKKSAYDYLVTLPFDEFLKAFKDFFARPNHNQFYIEGFLNPDLLYLYTSYQAAVLRRIREGLTPEQTKHLVEFFLGMIEVQRIRIGSSLSSKLATILKEMYSANPKLFKALPDIMEDEIIDQPTFDTKKPTIKKLRRIISLFEKI